MLGKLFKEECKSYCMPFGITFLTGIIFTIFMKIVCMLPYQREVKAAIQGIGFYGYYYIIMLIGVAATVFVVVRFYTTMVGDRGYLTWTLPAKSSTIIWSKLLAGVLWRLIATVGIFFLFGIFMYGKYWIIWGDFTMDLTLNETNVTTLQMIFSELLKMFEPRYLLPIFLGLLTMVAFEFMSQLLIYFCIAIGQLFGKWRIIASLGCYFLLMILYEILMIMGIAVMTIGGVSAASVGFLESMSAYEIINFILSILLVSGTLTSVLFFALNNWIFKKHLNLE
ncbi:MAG: hypothetical protein NC347_02560 [Clostridium sp.]|nr:hypothetical protein [Clostridium sp.]